LADSYLPASSVTAAAAALQLPGSDLPASFLFQAIAVEILGPINDLADDFLRELGRRSGIPSAEGPKLNDITLHFCL